MAWFDSALKALGLQRAAAPRRKRAFDAAIVNRLTADWTTTTNSANRELRMDLRALRGRSRELARNNDYAKRFLSMVSANIVGPTGVGFEAQAKTARGKADKATNETLEAAWKEWSRKGVCTADGRHSWADFQRLVAETVAMDGEAIVRVVRGRGPFGFQLQLLDVDQIADQQEAGGKPSLGVETDEFGRPVSYLIYTGHPSETGTRTVQRVPARDILHLFRSQRAGQSRGVPWMHSAMKTINQLDGYMEAELVAARTAAAKMGFFVSEMGEAFGGDDEDEATGAPQMEANPGVFESLPPGYDFKAFDPQHPTAAFRDFQKAILRSIASGMGVSYNTLANDLEGVNFSSIRTGVLEEREQWKMLQRWFIEHFLEPVYEGWLEMAIMSGKLKVDLSKGTDGLRCCVKWKPRGWSWVDPLKDVQAAKEALAAGLTTRADVLAAQGKDVEEVFEQLERETELIEQYELHLEADPGAAPPAPAPTPAPAGDTETEDPAETGPAIEEEDDAA